MPVVDPSGIIISVIIKTRRGAEFPLWMGGATQGSGPDEESIFLNPNARYQDLPIVTGVNIELTRNYNATCTVELSATYDLGLELLESDLFIVGNRISVEVGYPRIGLFMPRISVMAVKPSITINPEDGLTATLNGQGGTFAAVNSRNTRQWENVSIVDVIQELASLPHNKWRVFVPSQRTASVEAPPPDRLPRPSASTPSVTGDPQDPLYSERPSVSQQNETDWAFLRRLVRRAACSITVRPIPNRGGRTYVIIRRDGEIASRPPVFTLVSRSQIDMVAPNGRFPLLSLESEAEQVWFQPGSDRAETADVEPESGEPTGPVTSDQESLSASVSTATPMTAGSGSSDDDEVTVAIRTAPEDGRDLVVYAPASDRSRTPQEAVDQANREAAARGAGIQVTVSSIGLPMAFPDDRIRLEGVGLFNGNYEIDGMSHQVAEGDWTTSYRLIRRGEFDTRYYDEILRRAQEFDAADEEPEGQPEVGQDAQGGGDITVEPGEISEEELGGLTGIDL